MHEVLLCSADLKLRNKASLFGGVSSLPHRLRAMAPLCLVPITSIGCRLSLNQCRRENDSFIPTRCLSLLLVYSCTCRGCREARVGPTGGLAGERSMQPWKTKVLCAGRYRPRQFEYHPLYEDVVVFGTLRGETWRSQLVRVLVFISADEGISCLYVPRIAAQIVRTMIRSVSWLFLC